MLVPSVCIDAVFEGVSTQQGVAGVAHAGYPAFEFWAWWEKDLALLKKLCDHHQLKISSCCTKFITLTDPERRDEYIEGVQASIEAAKQIHCPTLISQVGDFREGISRRDQHQSIVEGLREVAPMLESSETTLVIEPLNEVVDHPGYYLVHSDEAFEIIDEVNSPNVKVVFDIYHQQISEGNLISRIKNNIDKIGHFHAAGNPGRNELDRGEIYYPAIFDAIRSTHYSGYVGLEYWPVDQPINGLAEVATWFK